MIIKLHTPFTTYARHRETKAVQPLTVQDKIKTDRFVMVMLLLMTIAGAIVAS